MATRNQRVFFLRYLAANYLFLQGMTWNIWGSLVTCVVYCLRVRQCEGVVSVSVAAVRGRMNFGITLTFNNIRVNTTNLRPTGSRTLDSRYFVEDTRPLCQLSSKRLEDNWHSGLLSSTLITISHSLSVVLQGITWNTGEPSLS